jgi:SAM-dependent methyltransferase
MKNKFNWRIFHNQVKEIFFSIDKNLWWGDDLDVRFYLLSKIINFKNKKILDIGCNVGVTLSFLDSSNELFGLDINKKFLSEAKKINPGVNFSNLSMNKLPYKSDFFDVILMMNVIPSYDFKLNNPNKNEFIEQTFNEVYRVLKKNGRLYLSTPNGDSFYYSSGKIKFAELQDLLGQYNYELKISGWNSIFSRHFSFLAKLLHPKVLCLSNKLWQYLVTTISSNVLESKYYYVEAIRTNED